MLKSIYHKDKVLTIGILGGGQLAKMLAAAAYRIGLNVAIIENHTNSPAGDMTKYDFSKGWNNKEELDKFIEVSDVITLENEFIDTEILEYIETKREVFPSSKTMKLVQDKFHQKTVFKNNNLPVPHFEKIDNVEQAIDFGKNYGYPYILKARKLGYDGYGNSTIFDETSAIEAFNKFNNEKTSREMMAETFVEFEKELAVIVARNKKGEEEIYPTVETVQYKHICHEVIAPADIDPNIRKEAQKLALSAVRSINGIGVFGVELFLTKDKKIIINEIAPRPHNSGHYSIEACYTSQFENCIRAVLGLSLGSSELITNAAVMINLLGQHNGIGIPENIEELLLHKKVFIHLYNKKESRVGRKMGHITALGNNQSEAYSIAKSASQAIVW